MYAAFAARAIDPPFARVTMETEESRPEEAGEYLKTWLAEKGVKHNNLLTCSFGGLANAEGTDFSAEFTSDESLAVLATGEITNIEEIADLYSITPLPESTADLLAVLYNQEFIDKDGDGSDQPMTAISSFEGSWAFIMYDADSEYFLAARSACGSHPLYWGTAATNEDLVLVSSIEDGLTNFPAGCCFESHGDTTGDLENFTRHNPRRRPVNAFPSVDSHGHLQSLKYTTPSGHDLQSMAAET